jgi:hypothetical protein
MFVRVCPELVKQIRADQHGVAIDTATNLHSALEKEA